LQLERLRQADTGTSVMQALREERPEPSKNLLGLPTRTHLGAWEDWPEPDLIGSELPPVNAFPEEILPGSIKSQVMDISERMQVPPDYPAAVAVLALAGAVNRRAVIQPKVADTSWKVVPNLWGGIIGPPGFMKSPVIQCAIRPLNKIQTEWRQ